MWDNNCHLTTEHSGVDTLVVKPSLVKNDP